MRLCRADSLLGAHNHSCSAFTALQVHFMCGDMQHISLLLGHLCVFGCSSVLADLLGTLYAHMCFCFVVNTPRLHELAGEYCRLFNGNVDLWKHSTLVSYVSQLVQLSFCIWFGCLYIVLTVDCNIKPHVLVKADSPWCLLCRNCCRSVRATETASCLLTTCCLGRTLVLALPNTSMWTTSVNQVSSAAQFPCVPIC